MGKIEGASAPTSYIIAKAAEGGFIVSQAWPSHPASYMQVVFASTTVEEALRYIKRKLNG